MPPLEPSKIETRPRSKFVRAIYLTIGIICLVLGILGVILPLLPGVPLLIVAAWCFARSSPKFERWLLNHPTFGPGIREWRARGAINTRAKILAIGMMTISGGLVTHGALNGYGPPVWIAVLIVLSLIGAAIFVGTRPK